jgi:hypothetical protein
MRKMFKNIRDLFREPWAIIGTVVTGIGLAFAIYSWHYDLREDIQLNIDTFVDEREISVATSPLNGPDSTICFVDFVFESKIYNNSKTPVIIKDAKVIDHDRAGLVVSNPFKYEDSFDPIKFPLAIEANGYKTILISFPISIYGKGKKVLFNHFGEGIHKSHFRDVMDLLLSKGVMVYHDASLYGRNLESVYDKFLEIELITAKGNTFKKNFGVQKGPFAQND